MTAPSRQWWRLALALIACVVGWAAMRRHVLFGTDLGLWDETAALRMGAGILRGQWPPWSPAGSPLYGAWHALWLAATGDPFTSYFVQWLAADFLLLLAVFATARGLGWGHTSAAIAALVWSSTSVAAQGWPRVYLFALLVLLLGQLIARTLHRAWPAGLALGLAAFVRPEYQLSVVLWCAWMAGQRLNPRQRKIGLAVTIAATAIAAAALPWGAGRMWVAFTQHVSLRYAAAHPGVLSNAWLQAPDVAASLFPGAHSVSQAIAIAPARVAGHVLRNLFEYPVVLVASVANWPDAGFPLSSWAGRAFLIAAAITTIARYRARSRGGAAKLVEDDRHRGLLVVCAASAIVPSLLVMSKATYAVVIVLVLVLYGVGVLAWAWRTLVVPRIPRASAVPVVVLAVLAVGPWFLPSPPHNVRGVLRTGMSLQQVWVRQPPSTAWRMLEADGGWCTYLDVARCTTVGTPATTKAFPRFIEDQRINSIVVTPSLAQLPAFRDDPEFKAFLADPAPFGFEKIFTNGWATLFLRR